MRGFTLVFVGALMTQSAVAEAPPPDYAKQRAQLRHCAAQWAKLKHSGEADGKLWRDFAASCQSK